MAGGDGREWVIQVEKITRLPMYKSVQFGGGLQTQWWLEQGEWGRVQGTQNHLAIMGMAIPLCISFGATSNRKLNSKSFKVRVSHSFHLSALTRST